MIEINGHKVTLERLLETQEAVDKVNEGRREARRLNRQLLICRLAALRWVESNPVKAAMYR